MRYDRFLSMKARVKSLENCTDLTVTYGAIECQMKGRCSPYISHVSVTFSAALEPTQSGVFHVENSKFSLAFAKTPPDETGNWELFPYSIFEGLFESLKWGKNEFVYTPGEGSVEFLWVYVADVRTRKEIEGAEAEAEAEAATVVDDLLLIYREDAIAAGLCESGVDEWLAYNTHVDPGDGRQAIRGSTLKALAKESEDAKKLLVWVIEQCASEEFIEARMLPGEKEATA